MKRLLIALSIAVAMLCSNTVLSADKLPATEQARSLLDLNSATEAQLEALEGIGEKRAKAIVKGRPYKGKDELLQKNIVPQAVYDKIKDRIIAKQK